MATLQGAVAVAASGISSAASIMDVWCGRVRRGGVTVEHSRALLARNGALPGPVARPARRFILFGFVWCRVVGGESRGRYNAALGWTMAGDTLDSMPSAPCKWFSAFGYEAAWSPARRPSPVTVSTHPVRPASHFSRHIHVLSHPDSALIPHLFSRHRELASSMFVGSGATEAKLCCKPGIPIVE
ncbi:hypothetical protein BC567DRAFT_251268 [Phyllosticta citribraziliensis]